MLSSINDLLEHIQEVEKDIVELSQNSTLVFGEFLEKNGIEPDENVTHALQRQDMISQQLSATIEVIDKAKSTLELFQESALNDDGSIGEALEQLDVALGNALKDAKEKKEAFSGHFHSQDDNEIEFF